MAIEGNHDNPQAQWRSIPPFAISLEWNIEGKRKDVEVKAGIKESAGATHILWAYVSWHLFCPVTGQILSTVFFHV